MAETQYERFEQIDWSRWRPDERATLCFVIRDGEILLIRKKRGLGAGKINGPGGRQEQGESIEACAIREVREEVGLEVADLERLGRLRFQFTDGYSIGVTVFRTSVARGEPIDHLEYEAYPPMAVREMEKIAEDAARRWPGSRVAIAHRAGHLEVGELAVVIAAAAPHRAEAFAACRFAIDTLKETVPIWKKPVFEE